MLNNVTLIGRMVADAEMRTTASGKSVANFRIAVDRSRSKGGNKETDFISIVAWEGTATFIEKYFKKGDMIAIQGRIQTRNYEDNNGNKRTAFEVVANETSFCGGRNETLNNTANVPEFEEIEDDEEVPF